MNNVSYRLPMLKDHALNELKHSPGSVTAQDRLLLIGEIERLQGVILKAAQLLLSDADGRETAALLNAEMGEWP